MDTYKSKAQLKLSELAKESTDAKKQRQERITEIKRKTNEKILRTNQSQQMSQGLGSSMPSQKHTMLNDFDPQLSESKEGEEMEEYKIFQQFSVNNSDNSDEEQLKE